MTPGERVPEPDTGFEFLDDSAAVNEAGLREELHERAPVDSPVTRRNGQDQ